MAENYDVLFAPGVEAKVPEVSGSIEEFRPSAAKGQNGVYQAIVRFVPWYKNPKYGSIKEKWSCWLVDPVSETGKSIDCPSSIGKPSILQDMYFKCKNSDNVLLKSKMDVFSRRKTYASLIQVVKDDQNKESEGKILIWKYGVKIWEKINAELKPVIGDKHDPFGLVDGKAFALIITKVSGYNNYDQSKFLDKRIPFIIPDAEGNLKTINENTDKKTVFDYVKDNSPDLDKYDYKEWTQDTLDYVNKVILAVTGVGNIPANTASALNASKNESDGSGITSTDISLPEIAEIENVDIPNLDMPSLSEENTDIGSGISGDLADAIKGL